MDVKILNNNQELNTVSPVSADTLLWGTTSAPGTRFYLGFVPEDGFYLQMVCEEKNPRRIYRNHKDPVYQDSAMEAFFQFTPDDGFSDVYLNFEANANGALLAAYGSSQTDRAFFTNADYEAFQCRSRIEEDTWTVSLRIPLSVLERIYGPLTLKAGSVFKCNFYKIAEAADIEHYASYAPILTSAPCFHMPEYFASAVLD